MPRMRAATAVAQRRQCLRGWGAVGDVGSDALTGNLVVGMSGRVGGIIAGVVRGADALVGGRGRDDAASL